ncbi:TPA: D-glycero-beta-D-manno-heptose 1,7-bisphosphate 7-phosphatase [archaeon]|nr:D-glycero-beta-D-manno-heptose 1,7-bisphosphate 7-phosphatase [Candidatus Naiadarchaeales archaeon SRR2090153.bin1042]
MGKAKKTKKVSLKKAIFLDRDGTINEDNLNYIKSWGEFKFLPKSKSAIRQLNRAGYLVIVITNQAGVGKGLYAEKTLNEINQKMQDELKLADAHADAIYYCPHSKEEACNCRKPKTGMIDKAVKLHKIDLSKSWIVGDSVKHDIPLGKSAGLKTILVKSGRIPNQEEIMSAHPDYVVEDLMEAVQVIKGSVFGAKK